jgi:Right handed beta helix region
MKRNGGNITLIKTSIMKKHISLLLFVFLFMAILPSFSQATRTWISGVGDDVNPCSRTAPCKTLAGAISKTATGGEINILDPGGFGAVTITKSITIDGGGIIGSILSSGTNGIIINAPDGIVTIRNFSVNGAGTTLGINGIRVMAAKKLHVENCTLSNFSANGIDINLTAAADVVINDVTIHNGSNAISITNPAGSVVIDGCRLQTIQNSGINVINGQATVSNSVISGCTTGIDVKTGSTIHLSGNSITNNTTALQGPGKINSAANNSITGNKAQGATVVVEKLQ